MADKISSTQELVYINKIRDGVLILKDGSMRAVIELSAINFELRSEEEQIAIVTTFQNFINSIDFPLQIVINSRLLSVVDYLKYVDKVTEGLDNELLKIQAIEYRKFVKELSSLTNIMSKKFYIIIPYYTYESPTKTGIFSGIKDVFKQSSALDNISDERFTTYRNQLMQRVELVFGGLVGIGLKTKQLFDDELIKIFYDLYNPTIKITEEKE